ncbi:hypothetical protein F5050DRAFT_1567270, partial [Lentinula boryana]
VTLLTKKNIVWVHCDLRPMNIMICNGRVSGVIDRENSGWYPRHWQLLVVRLPFGSNIPYFAKARKRVTYEEDVEQAYEAA